MTLLTSPINICLASLYFFPAYSGPAVRFRQYAPHLRAQGIQMYVLSGGLNPSSKNTQTISHKRSIGQLLAVESVDDILVQRFQLPSEHAKRHLKIYGKALNLYVRQTPIPLQLIQMLTLPPVQELLSLKRTGLPLVFTHTMLSEFSQHHLKRQLQRIHRRMPFQLLDCVVVSSKLMEESLRELGVSKRIEVIPNGVNLTKFHPVDPESRLQLRHQLGLGHVKQMILFIGPITPRKGVETLLEAWNLIGDNWPDSYLVIVGPRDYEAMQGVMRPEFHLRINTLLAASKAGSRVIFTGPSDSVAHYLQAADIFVFPSYREGMPNVVLEAFASGTPSILVPFSGLSDELGKPDEEYILVERTPEALIKAIITLLEDDTKRQKLGQTARIWVERHLGVEDSIARYVDLYRDIISNFRLR